MFNVYLIQQQRDATMKTFTILNTAKILTYKGLTIQIKKVQKDGTNRVFFAPYAKNMVIGSTKFLRLYDCKTFSKDVLKRIHLNQLNILDTQLKNFKD